MSVAEQVSSFSFLSYPLEVLTAAKTSTSVIPTSQTSNHASTPRASSKDFMASHIECYSLSKIIYYYNKICYPLICTTYSNSGQAQVTPSIKHVISKTKPRKIIETPTQQDYASVSSFSSSHSHSHPTRHSNLHTLHYDQHHQYPTPAHPQSLLLYSYPHPK